MAKERGYIGKIKNQSGQFVSAPNQSTPEKKGKVKNAGSGDLRVKKG